MSEKKKVQKTDFSFYLKKQKKEQIKHKMSTNQEKIEIIEITEKQQKI